MIINFEKIEETRIPQFKGGTGDTISDICLIKCVVRNIHCNKN